jgi:hypothetical protein
MWVTTRKPAYDLVDSSCFHLFTGIRSDSLRIAAIWQEEYG